MMTLILYHHDCIFGGIAFGLHPLLTRTGLTSTGFQLVQGRRVMEVENIGLTEDMPGGVWGHPRGSPRPHRHELVTPLAQYTGYAGAQRQRVVENSGGVVCKQGYIALFAVEHHWGLV